MFQSLLPSLQRAAAVHRHALRAPPARLPPARSSSSSTKSSSVPPIPSDARPATHEEIAQAKDLLTSTGNPRSKWGPGKRSFPSYRGLPTGPRNAREATTAPSGRTLYPSKVRYDTGVRPEDMPFLHHAGHDAKPRPKFKNPRKRASKLFHELRTEAIAKSRASKPAVWEVPFKVGDAVELEVLEDGGPDNALNKRPDVIRGVVLGRENKGLDTSIYLKDVLYGDHVERKVKLHSPMVKTLKVLEEGFIYRGKKKGKKVRRAKLYYLRDRNMEGECGDGGVVLPFDARFPFCFARLTSSSPCSCVIETRVTKAQK